MDDHDLKSMKNEIEELYKGDLYRSDSEYLINSVCRVICDERLRLSAVSEYVSEVESNYNLDYSNDFWVLFAAVKLLEIDKANADRIFDLLSNSYNDYFILQILLDNYLGYLTKEQKEELKELSVIYGEEYRQRILWKLK